MFSFKGFKLNFLFMNQPPGDYQLNVNNNNNLNSYNEKIVEGISRKINTIEPSIKQTKNVQLY